MEITRRKHGALHSPVVGIEGLEILGDTLMISEGVSTTPIDKGIKGRHIMVQYVFSYLHTMV